MTINMECQRFLELEYMTLRKEIEDAKANMFKLVVGGAAVIPAAQSIANNFSIGAITLALPMIVAVLVLLFLSENHSIMRAGTYILEQIEPNIDGVTGWESWLNSTKSGAGNRTGDRLIVIAFSLLAASYFVTSVILAVRHALQEFGQLGQYLLGGAYIGVGVVLMFIFFSQARTSTTR